MGIDYVIPQPCENREQLGEPGLRRWTFLYMIHKYLRDHPELSRKDLSAKRWRMPTIRGLEVEEQDFGFDDVARVGREIGRLIRRCRDCPANMDPQADEFGCVGRINYPLQGCFEELVAERLQKVMDRLGQEEWPTLLNLILRSDSPFDGQAIASMRRTTLRRESRLLERTEPVRFQRAGDGISTDHILHALVGMSSERTERTGYGREFPRELLSIYLDFLSGILYAGLSEERVLRLSRECSTYLQFRWMHRALRLAYKLGTPVLIS
ncbi:MAG: hypothetical protein JW819_07710 [Candidatus Krumholzibacteriota bacterium]|nr:hypothetical protein [Candidatus Krumholzibacteriota bacterium]